MENFQQKRYDIFHIFAQNIDCEYSLETPGQGSFNEYPQSMFGIKNKKNRHTRVYPIFSVRMWGVSVYTFHGHVFVMLYSKGIYTTGSLGCGKAI